MQFFNGPSVDPLYLQYTGSVATGTLALAAFSELTDDGVVAPWANEPPPPTQPVAPLVTNAIDSRPTDAIWQANALSWVSTEGCAPDSDLSLQDCARVTQINTANADLTNAPAPIQDFLIADADEDNYYAGIGQALDGTLHVVWTKSDAVSIYPSSYAAYQLPDDPLHSLSAPELLKAGTVATFTGGRWGDYNGVSQDPQVPNAVWQANMYSGGGLLWKTFVSQLQTGGSSYVPITPLRVVDSRPPPLGVTGVFNASVPRSFQVAGVGTIPSDAVAVTGNVTVTGQTAAGFVAVTPTSVVNPTSSTINVPLGDTRANNFTSPLSATGRLSAVFKASAAGQKAHVIVDITGYFLAGETHATYNTLPPVRLMDTRAGLGHVGPLNTFHAGTSQQLPVASVGGVPANAVAITANLTITGQTKAGLLSVTPAMPSGPPTSSTLNAPLGDTRANGLTARLNGTGGLWITYSTTGAATAEVLLDVTGYYLQDNTGLLFYPLTPGRILDSRPGAVLSGLAGLFTTGGPRRLDIDGHWGAPAGAAAVTGNLTVVGQTAAGFLAITPASDPAPTTSTMNFPLGDIRANGVTVPLNGSGNMYLVYKTTAAGKKTHVLLDLSGYFK